MNGDGSFCVWQGQLPAGQTYQTQLAQDLSACREQEALTDVKIRCSNGVLSAQKMMLSSKSKLLRDCFASAASCPYATADIFCLDWSVETLTKVLEFIYDGVTQVETRVNINANPSIFLTV